VEQYDHPTLAITAQNEGRARELILQNRRVTVYKTAKQLNIIVGSLSLWGASCCVTYIYYISIQHKKPYICDPQRQLTTSLLFQNLTTCFGPYGPSSGDIFEDSHSTATHTSFFKSMRLSIAS
jgi:hypothetical protein